MNLSYIRVVHFQFCHDSECNFSQDLHLAVGEQVVEIKQGNAVAVSYTWGEFNRKDAVVGHKLDGSPVKLNLGEEWVVADVIMRLQELCFTERACWIDQLCIPQTSEEVREALASIPEIYRTLDVVVLLPGSLCACMQENEEMLANSLQEVESSSPNRTHDEDRKQDRELLRVWVMEMMKCVNSIPCISWFSRLWTRQEFLYSTRIRIAWASDDKAQCYKLDPSDSPLLTSDDDLHKLNPLAGSLFRKSIQDGEARLVALKRVIWYRNQVASIGMQAMNEHRPVNSETGAAVNLCRFFLGDQLDRFLPPGITEFSATNLADFFLRLASLGTSRKAATHQRDYVVAVWVDCPGYVLPVEYKTMSLVSLLENALDQLELKLGFCFPVTAPSGLFGGVMNTGLWRPSTYLQGTTVKDTMHVYGTVQFPATPVRLDTDRRIPIKKLTESTQALSQVSAPYEQVFTGFSTAQVFEAMKRIMIDWDPQKTSFFFFSRESASQHLFDSTLEPSENYLFRRFLTDFVNSDRQPDELVQWDGPELDHYSIVYHMVCDMLSLDLDVCQSQGLVLMISLQASCLGLLRPPQGDANPASRRTILMQSGSGGLTVFEAECTPYQKGKLVRVDGVLRVIQDGPPLHWVCGVWVPTRALRLCNVDYAAVLEGSACQGLLT